MRTALREEEPGAGDEVEACWHPGSVLVFFFAATLISAVFFGLGYSFGHHGTAASEMSFGSVPAAGGLHAPRHVRAAAAIPGRSLRVAPAETGGARGHYMVQVGAVGSRREARKLVAELRKSGFRASVYPGRHDSYLHVWIGPFRTPEQANGMRRRVVASGYRAVLKRT